jgi:putative oxidoreductase
MNILIFIGRLMMSAMFLLGAYWHVTNWDIALLKTAATEVWKPDLFLFLATLLLGIGGISIFLGYKTRIGAALLILEIVATAIVFHPFWSVPKEQTVFMLLQFLNRTALCGGLVILLGTGPGSISIDHRSN